MAGTLVQGISWPAGLLPDITPEYPQAAFERKIGHACDQDQRCDRATGCVAPTLPQGTVLDVLPNDEPHARYVNDLRVFQLCRQLVLLSEKTQPSKAHFIDFEGPNWEETSFARTIQRWNGPFLWAPASASSDTITRFGDEARAVFGPIPDGDCSDNVARTIPLQIDGNIVDVKPNPSKPDQPLEFEHRDPSGNVVKWTNGIASCDKPSLAGSATFCGMNSRLSRFTKGSVEWLFFCRKSSASREIEPISYWQRDNPAFALYGVIGFNRLTGEIVYFDGGKDRGEFDWSRPFVPPGGHSYGDRDGRAMAENFYDPTFQIECSACHDNKNAYVVSPSIQQVRVGYLAGVHDETAIAFSLGNFLPAMSRSKSTPFRVIGSAYTGTHRISLESAMAVRDPTGNCTECHTLTTQLTGQRFAADAVAKEPVIESPTRSQFLRMTAERQKLREINSHRTEWASRAGAGKIHPWMAPFDGNDLSALPPEISSSDWTILSNCLWGAGGPECGYTPLYSACPAPEAPSGDTSKVSELTAGVYPAPRDGAGVDRVLRLQWRYLNNFGGVSQRDDIRFNIAVRTAEIPSASGVPAPWDFPGPDEASDDKFVAIEGETGMSGRSMLVRNISYFGHERYTEPQPSTDLREYRIDLPGKCNRRYLFRVVPKRFCFDQSVEAYGREDHVLYADVTCN